MSNIGIYGGTFDPPHRGHTSIIKFLLEKNIIDFALIIPCNQNPLKERKASPFNIRMEMTKKAFEEFYPKLTVLDIEENNFPSYTIDTLNNLFERKFIIKEDNIFLIIGEDEYASFTKWKEWERILTLVTLIVIERESSQVVKEIHDFSFIKITNMPSISSSTIRNSISNDQLPLCVRQEVLDIILKNKLYEKKDYYEYP